MDDGRPTAKAQIQPIIPTRVLYDLQYLAAFFSRQAEDWTIRSTPRFTPHQAELTFLIPILLANSNIWARSEDTNISSRNFPCTWKCCHRCGRIGIHRQHLSRYVSKH